MPVRRRVAAHETDSIDDWDGGVGGVWNYQANTTQSLHQHLGHEVCAGAGDGGIVLHMGNAGEGLRDVRGEWEGGWELEQA